MTSMQAEYQKMLNSQKQQAKTEHSNSEAEKDRIRKQKEKRLILTGRQTKNA